MKIRLSCEYWLCLFFTLLGVITVIATATTHEYAWLLSLGQRVLASGPPHAITDTAWPARPWIAQQWLPAAVLAWLVNLGVGPLFTLFVGLCVSVPLWVGAYFLRRAGTPQAISVVAISFAGFVLVQKAEFRVEPISWALLSLEMLLLSGPRLRAWLIIPLFILWANVHGSFVLGLILALPWLRTDRGLILPLFLACVATLITPYGVSLWMLTYAMVATMGFSHHVSEWMPFWIFHPEMLLPIILILGSALRWKWRGRMALLTLLMVALTLTSARATVVALGVIMPIVISTIRFPVPRVVWHPALVAFVCVLLACLVPISSFARQSRDFSIDYRFGVVVETTETAIASVPMKRHANVFCYPVGPCNLLLEKGLLPLMDGRTEAYPPPVLAAFFGNVSPWMSSSFTSCADYLVLGNVILGEDNPSRRWRMIFKNVHYRVYARTSAGVSRCSLYPVN